MKEPTGIELNNFHSTDNVIPSQYQIFILINYFFVVKPWFFK